MYFLLVTKSLVVDVSQLRCCFTETAAMVERESGKRHRQSRRDRDKDGDEDTDRSKHRSTERDKDRGWERDKERERDKDRNKDKSADRDRVKEQDKHNSREKDRERSHHKDRDRDKDSDRDKDPSREKIRERGKSRESIKDRGSDKEKERHRDTDRERDKERRRDSVKERGSDKERDRSRERVLERKRSREREHSKERPNYESIISIEPDFGHERRDPSRRSSKRHSDAHPKITRSESKSRLLDSEYADAVRDAADAPIPNGITVEPVIAVLPAPAPSVATTTSSSSKRTPSVRRIFELQVRDKKKSKKEARLSTDSGTRASTPSNRRRSGGGITADLERMHKHFKRCGRGKLSLYVGVIVFVIIIAIVAFAIYYRGKRSFVYTSIKSLYLRGERSFFAPISTVLLYFILLYILFYLLFTKTSLNSQ